MVSFSNSVLPCSVNCINHWLGSFQHLTFRQETFRHGHFISVDVLALPHFDTILAQGRYGVHWDISTKGFFSTVAWGPWGTGTFWHRDILAPCMVWHGDIFGTGTFWHGDILTPRMFQHQDIMSDGPLAQNVHGISQYLSCLFFPG